jgi:hypothetical protein
MVSGKGDRERGGVVAVRNGERASGGGELDSGDE